jgi:hypothetical protein
MHRQDFAANQPSELMNALGTGYFQQNFTTNFTKPSCTFGEVTKEKLAMRKAGRRCW